MALLDTTINERPQTSPRRRSAPATWPQVGNWLLTRRAGTGQWASVYRARPTNAPIDQPAAYAVKMMHESRQHDWAAVAMLAREAKIGRLVSHPHLIAILESQLKRAPQFLVMPWLEGATLQSYVAVRQSLDLPAVLWIARQTLEALEALDQAGWMHGDIKPSNIFVSPRGHVTLLDLGFARHRDDQDETPQSIAGTGHYIAPEHVSAAYRPDIRSDIYSLGVVLYQLLAGRLPLEGATFEQMALAHKQTAPLNLRRLAPHVPSGAAELVHRMLAKDPLRRPQSPAELVAELVRLEIETFSERAA
jgi:eukaryotic-like serine/threonine-protein kinase